jgi:DNA-binding HxlR family transcriptional regulator
VTRYVPDAAFCPHFRAAVELIGGRWTGAIVRALLTGITRFSDLANAIPGLSDRMLSVRLKDLEAEGIVSRTVIPETPVRVEYRLTPKGQALADVVESIATWVADWSQQPTSAPRARRRKRPASA